MIWGRAPPETLAFGLLSGADLITLAFLLSLLLQQEAPPGPQAVEPPATAPVNPLTLVHGNLSFRFRNRWNGDVNDNDLYEYLSAFAGDPEKDLLSFSASARFAEDLDGNRKVTGFYPYNSLADTYQSASTAQLYTAYVDFNPRTAGMRLRGGRQVLEEFVEALPFDGGTLRFDSASGIRAGAFGGLPVNLYESATRGDATYGGWAEAKPWQRTLVRVEYLHVKDENMFGLFKDDLVGFVAEQGLGPLFARVRYALLEGESRDIVGRLSASLPETGLVADGLVTYLFKEMEEHSYPLDAYSSFMMTLEPYLQWTVRASQALGTLVSIDGIVSQRILVHGAQDSTYNHEFVHATLAPRLSGWPIEGLSLSVSGDYWRSTADDYWTAGADLSFRVQKEITLGAGSSYALYSVDAFTGEEHQRVRLFYGTTQWKFGASSVLDVRLSYEVTSDDTFRVLEVGVRHAF